MTDIRAEYWLEADRNIREAAKHDLADTSWVLNILAAISNALMASVPLEVVAEARDSKEATQRRVQGGIRKTMKGK